jgi:Rod binding domain-containing protein
MSVLASLPVSNTSPATAAAPSEVKKVDPALVEAARQFEAIFVRQLLAPMEKSQGLGNEKQAGAGIYGSMVTGALADNATRGDGLGLAALILETLTGHLATENRPPGPQADS